MGREGGRKSKNINKIKKQKGMLSGASKVILMERLFVDARMPTVLGIFYFMPVSGLSLVAPFGVKIKKYMKPRRKRNGKKEEREGGKNPREKDPQPPEIIEQGGRGGVGSGGFFEETGSVFSV